MNKINRPGSVGQQPHIDKRSDFEKENGYPELQEGHTGYEGSEEKRQPTKKETQFIKVPWNMLDDKCLSSTDKLVYGLLLSYSKREGYAFASNEQLAKVLGVSPSTISNSISKLEKDSYIEIKEPRGPHRKIYV